jgi:hypothetical protein
MKKNSSNYAFEIINTHGTIAGASRRDAATVVFEDAQSFVNYVTCLHCKVTDGHPLLVLRGKIVVPASYSDDCSPDEFDDGLAYLEHLPKVQAYFIPRKQ